MDAYTWHVDSTESLAKIDHRDQGTYASALESLDRSSIGGVAKNKPPPSRSSDFLDQELSQARFSDYQHDGCEPRTSNYQLAENHELNLARSSDYKHAWTIPPNTARASDVRHVERIDVYPKSSDHWLPNASDTAAIAAPSTQDTGDNIGKTLYAMTPETAPPMCRTALREMLKIVQNDEGTVPNSIRQYLFAIEHSGEGPNMHVPTQIPASFIFACDTVDRITLLVQKLTVINHYPRGFPSPIDLRSLAEHCKDLRNLSGLLRSCVSKNSPNVHRGGNAITLSRAISRALHYQMDAAQDAAKSTGLPPETSQALNIVIEEGTKVNCCLEWLGKLKEPA